MVLRNIGILSCGKMFGVVGASIGLALGCFFSVLSVVGTVLHNFTSRVSPPESVFMLGAVLIFPVVYGAMGFAAGIVGAFAYNLGSSRFGGIELDLTPPSH